MAEESYEDLLDFFDKGKDENSSADINLNSDGSCLQPSEEENNVNVSHESSKVLTDIDNLLNESSYGTDVSDNEEQQIKREEVEKASEEATESLENINAVAGVSAGKRKALEDVEDLLAADPKSCKLDSASGDNQDEGDEVDDRLLDGEDDEDGDVDTEMSFDEMAALLEETEEEESQEGTGTERTEIPETGTEVNETAETGTEGNETPRIETPQITRFQISRRLRELKIKYKDVLQQVCNMYGLKWPISSIDPIVHRDLNVKITKQSWEKTILGIEGLQEYIDNQHPLWGYDRALVEQIENNSPMMSMAPLWEHVHTRWGNQNINPRSSLVVVEGFKEKEENREHLATTNSLNLQPKTEDPPEMDLHKRAIKTIMEMDIDSISQEVLEKEKKRKTLYEQKVDPLFVNVRNEQMIPSSTESLLQFTGRIRVEALEKKWSVDRTEGVIAGTQEAAGRNAYYGGGMGVSEEQINTILDMEEAHDKIQKISVDEKAEDENKNNFINGFMKKGFLENA